jgi:hypothetical protein
MDIAESTRSYERWLERQIDVVPADLERKHDRMREDAFVFFRATYFRWLQQLPDVAPELDGPRVACVGDLHVENFGTWRDAEGRLVWGINDFDESEELPYTLDLARLATSAALAIATANLASKPADGCAAILAGYTDALAAGGRPFVLAGGHERLARLVAGALDDPDDWWQELLEPEVNGGLPAPALKALEPLLPSPDWSYATRPRVAGVGSLGHRRLVVTGDWGGAPAARELKQLSPPAGHWLERPPTASAEDGRVTVRPPDPLRSRRAGWLCRRIAPDCVKLDLGDLGKKAHERRLFKWMGAETANVHLGTAARVADIRADLEQRGSDWLEDAVARLADAARRDWKDWQDLPLTTRARPA